VAVANFYNSSKKYLKFAIVRISKVGRMLERLRKVILTTTIVTITLLDQCHCPFRAYGVSNALNLKIDLDEAKEVESKP
jgi:hypothetical protein